MGSQRKLHKGPERSAELERTWRGIMSQWKASGLECRAFIRKHSLPEASFYGWKRTLRLRDAERAKERERQARKAKRRPRQTDRHQGKSSSETSAPAFIPVSVTPPRSAPVMELILAGGRTLRLSSDFDEATLRRLLSILERS